MTARDGREARYLERVQAVLRDVLDSSELVLSLETPREGVPGWDNVSHLDLVVALKRERV